MNPASFAISDTREKRAILKSFLLLLVIALFEKDFKYFGFLGKSNISKKSEICGNI
jgi:hypothetical protein